MSVSESTSTGVQHFNVRDFTFQDGTRLPNVQLAYRDINSQASKVALISTCFRGRIDTTLTFANSALQEYRIIVVALFGNGESSSPSNTPGFPKLIDYRDCVRAQHALLTQHLNIHSLNVILGFSMGGQCAYYWTAMHPDFIRNAIIICSSARTSRHNYQFLEGPKAALENAVDYAAESSGSQKGRSPRGLKAFGKAYSAWLTSAEWFEQGLHSDLGFNSLQEWDANVTEAGYRDWDPDDLLSKLRMWQNGDISVCSPSGRASLEETLAQIKTRILLLPCQTDQYFQWNASAKECQYLANAELNVIPSVWGHLAGGGSSSQDAKWIDDRITRFLTEG